MNDINTTSYAGFPVNLPDTSKARPGALIWSAVVREQLELELAATDDTALSVTLRAEYGDHITFQVEDPYHASDVRRCDVRTAFVLLLIIGADGCAEDCYAVRLASHHADASLILDDIDTHNHHATD